MTRNVVAPETAEANREEGTNGSYTFNAPIPREYDGICIVIAALRLGDHAHLDIWSGRHIPARTDGQFEGTRNVGHSGRLILRWDEWLMLRGILDDHEGVLIREVERATLGQLEYHAGGRSL